MCREDTADVYANEWPMSGIQELRPLVRIKSRHSSPSEVAQKSPTTRPLTRPCVPKILWNMLAVPVPGSVLNAKAFRAVHADFYKGIYVPAGSDVATSIRFKPVPNPMWGYSDKWIAEGRTLDYTGQGGPPLDQGWNRFNLGLRIASETGSWLHVFEVLRASPRTYLYWGEWNVGDVIAFL